MGGSDEFEAASRAYWRERHRAVQHLSDSQYLLAHMVRLPLYLWETAVPATGAVIVADMLHSYAKGFRAASIGERIKASGPVGVRTALRMAGLVVLQQATEQALCRTLRVGERYEADPYDGLGRLTVLRAAAGLAAGAAVAAVGKHGFSFFHSAARAARHPKHVYVGAWSLAGGFWGMSGTAHVASVSLNARAAWGEALGGEAAPADLKAQVAASAAQARKGGEDR